MEEEIIEDAIVTEDVQPLITKYETERLVRTQIKKMNSIIGQGRYKQLHKGANRAQKRAYYKQNCICGSGRKYKNCCYYKDLQDIETKIEKQEAKIGND